VDGMECILLQGYAGKWRNLLPTSLFLVGHLSAMFDLVQLLLFLFVAVGAVQPLSDQ